MPSARSIRLSPALVVALCSALFGGQVREAHGQGCPTSSVSVNAYSDVLPGPDGFGSYPVYFGNATFWFHDFGDSAAMDMGSGGTANLAVRATYRFLGVPEGTPVTQTVYATLRGSISTASGDPQCGSNFAMLLLLLDNAAVIQRQWRAEADPTFFDCLGRGGIEPGEYTISRPAGTAFELSPVLIGNTSERASSSLGIRLRFGNITPGAFLVRCDGATVPQTVGVSAVAPSGLRIGSVWPNPSRGSFRADVFVPAGSPAILRLLDVSGRVIRSRTVDASTMTRELSFDTGLAPGCYFLHLQQGAQAVVRRVLVGD